jgi:hypothetical protein
MAVSILLYNSGGDKSYVEHMGVKYLQPWTAEVFQKGSTDYVKFKGVKLQDMSIEVPLSEVTFEGEAVTKTELLEIIENNK